MTNSRIFVTGDIHGQPAGRFCKIDFPEGCSLTKNDYIIILGDFGLIWDKTESKAEKHWLDWLDSKPWTTLFIDGNHENYDRLNDFKTYPYEEWCGGLVQRIRPSVMHLCRGEIFNIDGYKFLAMGGANSHDIQHGIIDPADYATRDEMKDACRALEAKHGGWQFTMYRVKGESWWEQEVPNAAERDNCISNLSLVNNKVDFILSHEAPSSVVALFNRGYKPTEYALWLETELRQKVDYKKWYFGHYHIDLAINDRDVCFYESIRQIA